MIVTGKTIAAVMPQMSIAPQPPMSSTELPSDPSRKPGFARQMTTPSYPRSVFRSCRSSTTASATFPPLVFGNEEPATAITGRANEANTCRSDFQRPAAPPYNRCRVHRPPITITCECGATRGVPYGERWRCEDCGRSWNTLQIPPEEYEGLLRRVRRHQYEALGMAAI